MKKENINVRKLINDRYYPVTAFHCKTKKSVNELFNELSKLGYKWGSGHELSDFDLWHGTNTCYTVNRKTKTIGLSSVENSIRNKEFVYEYKCQKCDENVQSRDSKR